MKKKLLLFISLFCVVSANLFSQQSDVLKLKGVKMESDLHEKITWIKSKPVSLEYKDFFVSAYDCTHIELYFGLYLKDGVQKATPIRIVNTYKKANWIFFDEISYLVGSRKEILEGKGGTFKLYDRETSRKVKNGVTERSDVVASKEILEFIQYIASTPATRMECKYINNRDNEAYTLRVYKGSKVLKKHFAAFITAYNQVTNKFSLENQFNAK